ncbi:hypothetical protein [Bacillus thuringiensis]
MKKTFLFLLGIATTFSFILGNVDTQKKTHIPPEEVVQYSHGHTGG